MFGVSPADEAWRKRGSPASTPDAPPAKDTYEPGPDEGQQLLDASQPSSGPTKAWDLSHEQKAQEAVNCKGALCPVVTKVVEPVLEKVGQGAAVIQEPFNKAGKIAGAAAKHGVNVSASRQSESDVQKLSQRQELMPTAQNLGQSFTATTGDVTEAVVDTTVANVAPGLVGDVVAANAGEVLQVAVDVAESKVGAAVQTIRDAVKAPAKTRPRVGPNGELLSTFAKIEKRNLGAGTATTEAARDFARSLGNSTDDAGHAVGNALGGKGGKRSRNIFPQAPSVNRGAFNQFEQQIVGEVEAGKEVYVRVVPRYAPGSTRPYEILYQVRVDGETISRTFKNP
jgi:hypothetical protein